MEMHQNELTAIERQRRRKISQAADGNAIVVRKPRKIVVPCLELTELCEATDEGAISITICGAAQDTVFYERLKIIDTGQRYDGKPKWRTSQFNHYPLVLDATGLLWPEANVYILSKIENSLNISMSTFDGIADDLAAYCRYLENEDIDWRYFPALKLSRPTYRYNSHLMNLVRSSEVAVSSARRRMSSVIAFYKWLKEEVVLIFEHEPWKEKDVFVKLTGAYGFEFTKKITTTDVSIKVPKQDDPYNGRIQDGGKLRPLPLNEQHWVIEALIAQGNIEMTLIHLLALITGARIQTVLTFEVRNICSLVDKQLQGSPSTEIRCPVGPGTGIDTKGDKRMSLHLPLWLYLMLLKYASSQRARHRRTLAKGGDTDDQYLFLSKSGKPMYKSKKDSRTFDLATRSRNQIKGQSVRKFMSEVVIRYVRKKYDAHFHYQFHDLRASFGMNMTDSQLKLVAVGKRTLSEIREFVKVRMGHSSAATTDNYLLFRGNLAHIRQVNDDHDDYLRNLVEQAGLL